MDKINSIFAICILVILSSCTHDAKNIGEFEEVCFTEEILPIFKNSCSMTDCHDVSSAKAGLVYSDYSSILKSITPYNPGESKAYISLSDVWDEMMPPQNPLPQDSRTLIRIWIEQGAGNTNCIDSIDPDPGINDSICFQYDVLPILLSSCAVSDCHDDLTAEEDIILNSYNNVMNSHDGELIKPGEPWESDLIEVLTDDDPDDLMPPPPDYNPLSQVQIDIIYQWILEGALDIDCTELPCDTSNVTYTGVIWPLIQNNCLGCHSGTSPSDGISLEGYSNIMNIVSNGKLYNVINGNPQMPPNGTLSECVSRQIEIWLEDGAPNN